VQGGFVDIRDGEKAAMVTFEVVVDSDNLEFEESRKTITVDVARPSFPIDFPCSIVRGQVRFPVWVKVYASNSLLQVINVEVQFGGKPR